MLTIVTLALLPVQLPTVDSKEFSRELQERVLVATVRVANKDQGQEGSGVIVAQQGPFVYVLTAAHLVNQSTEVAITLYSAKSYPDPESKPVTASVLARTKGPDLALVRLVRREPVPGCLPLCPIEKCPTGNEFPGLTCGLDEKRVPTAWTDRVNGKKHIRKPGGDAALAWELDREPTAGRSGGPLIDKDGQLLGICSGRNDGKGYYTHLDEIYSFLKQNSAARPLLQGKN